MNAYMRIVHNAENYRFPSGSPQVLCMMSLQLPFPLSSSLFHWCRFFQSIIRQGIVGQKVMAFRWLFCSRQNREARLCTFNKPAVPIQRELQVQPIVYISLLKTIQSEAIHGNILPSRCCCVLLFLLLLLLSLLLF